MEITYLFWVNLGSPWVERSDNETKIQKIERLESFLHYIYIENIFASDPLHFFPRAKIIWWYIWRKGPFLNLILSHMQGRKGPFVSHNVLFLYNHTLWGNRAHGEETEQGVTERSDRTHLPPYPFRSLRPRGRRKGSVRREMGPNLHSSPHSVGPLRATRFATRMGRKGEVNRAWRTHHGTVITWLSERSEKGKWWWWAGRKWRWVKGKGTPAHLLLIPWVAVFLSLRYYLILTATECNEVRKQAKQMAWESSIRTGLVSSPCPSLHHIINPFKSP